MDVMDRDSADLGNLFQQIITDMKNTSPLWEDFVAKANKLHACLRAAIQAIAAYLDAFQKIADAATNSRGASKEIGTALTRVCLRHKAVETKMKTFTTAIMDYLITPLQDKLEEWRRQVVILDKEHAKEYKRCRIELKKHSSDTLRLQKKARKGQSEAIQSMVDSQMQNVTIRRAELEEVERKSLRAAMIQERIRYCSFVNMLQPVVKEECEVISELGHLQEAMQSIAIITKESNILPQSIEEIILESTATINFYPESPGGNSGSQICSSSLGSRKTSICSISSINSSGSNGSPGHHYQKPVSQLFSPLIHKCSESSDSGFSSSPALAWQAPPPTGPSHATSTWPPQSPDVAQTTDRPHTISSTYEKGHQRPAITVYTFQNPQVTSEVKKVPPAMPCRPPLPVRCSSLERPLSATTQKTGSADSIQKQCPSPIPTHIAKEFQQQPTYVNMSELASLAAMKVTHQHIKQNSYPRASDSIEIDAQSSVVQTSSNIPAGSANQTQCSQSNILRNKISSNLSGITSSKIISPQSTLRYSSSQSKSSPKIPLTNTIVRLTATEATTSDDTTDYTRKEANIKTVTEFCHTISNDPKSPNLTDDKSRGSVLEKTSMFEKLEQKQTSNSFSLPLTSGKCLQSTTPCPADSVHCSRKKDTSSTSTPTDSDADQFYEDSIQELNNLIGELDLFQREFETKEETSKFKMSKRCKSDDGNIQTQTFNYSDCNQTTTNDNLNSSMLSMNVNDFKLALSDSDLSRCVSDSSSQLSENHMFSRFDRNNEYCPDVNDHTTILNYNSNLGQDNDYIQLNSEIMIVHNNGSSTPKNSHSTETNPKLMSFRSEKQLSPVVQNRQQSIKQKKTKSLDQIEFNEVAESNEMIEPLTSLKGNVSDRLRPKPTILPRPASLSVCTLSKTAQRSSLNNKPLPPVRRSSSITPSPNITDAHSMHPNQQNTSHSVVENLPPPPAYLLDRTATASPTINVAETIKALTVINHTPASPSAIRRALAQSNQTPSPPQYFGAKKLSNSPIYVQPKQPAKMSSFKSPNTGSNTLGQKPSRISSMKQPVYQSTLQTESENYPLLQRDNKSTILQCAQQTDSLGTIYPSHDDYVHHDRIYSKTDTRSYPETQYYQSIQCNDYSISNVEKSENISRVRTEFLDNLNAKLSKQGLSRRAFAVRSLINSKALPDPRLCHESLMDQIKRGTRLKPNRTINDRSAPKII